MNNNITDVLIIGSGPAGIFASFQCGCFNLKTIIIDTIDTIGGQCIELYPEKKIFDIPGFLNITGKDLIQNLINQAAKFKPQYILSNQVIDVNINENNEYRFTIKTDKNLIIQAKAIIMATGSGAFQYNKLPLSNAIEFENKTLFYKIDNIEKFRNKNVAIIGGGDSAIDWTLELLDIANNITIIHRRDIFKAINSNIDILHNHINKNNGKINKFTPFILKEIIGKNGIIEKIIIKNLDNSIEQELYCDYLLTFFGLINDNKLISKLSLDKTKQNNINVNISTMETNIKGVFCIGDACFYNGKQKLILSSFHEASMAVHNATLLITKKNTIHFEHSTSLECFADGV